MGLVMTGPNGKPFAGIENEDAVGVASKSTVSSPENLVFQAGALAGEYTVTARHIGDNTMTSYVCSKTFTVVPAKKATTTTQIGTTTQSVAKLTTTKFIGASSTIIRVTRIPTEVKKKITACEYGWNRRAGSGITVDWGDGTVLSGSPDDKVPGTPCAGLTSHEYPHGLPGTQMYTIRMRTWHPGPTDAPVTDWEGTATVSIK
jgi:hypothetical protein